MEEEKQLYYYCSILNNFPEIINKLNEDYLNSKNHILDHILNLEQIENNHYEIEDELKIQICVRILHYIMKSRYQLFYLDRLNKFIEIYENTKLNKLVQGILSSIDKKLDKTSKNNIIKYAINDLLKYYNQEIIIPIFESSELPKKNFINILNDEDFFINILRGAQNNHYKISDFMLEIWGLDLNVFFDNIPSYKNKRTYLEKRTSINFIYDDYIEKIDLFLREGKHNFNINFDDIFGYISYSHDYINFNPFCTLLNIFDLANIKKYYFMDMNVVIIGTSNEELNGKIATINSVDLETNLINVEYRTGKCKNISRENINYIIGNTKRENNFENLKTLRFKNINDLNDLNELEKNQLISWDENLDESLYSEFNKTIHTELFEEARIYKKEINTKITEKTRNLVGLEKKNLGELYKILKTINDLISVNLATISTKKEELNVLSKEKKSLDQQIKEAEKENSKEQNKLDILIAKTTDTIKRYKKQEEEYDIAIKNRDDYEKQILVIREENIDLQKTLQKERKLLQESKKEYERLQKEENKRKIENKINLKRIENQHELVNKFYHIMEEIFDNSSEKNLCDTIRKCSDFEKQSKDILCYLTGKRNNLVHENIDVNMADFKEKYETVKGSLLNYLLEDKSL